MDFENLKKRLGPGMALGLSFMALLGLSSILCFGSLLLLLVVFLVTVLAGLECAQVFGERNPKSRIVFLLSLIPSISVTFSFIRSGVCGMDLFMYGVMEGVGVSLLAVIVLLFAYAVISGLKELALMQTVLSSHAPAVLFLAAGSVAFSVICCMPGREGLLGWLVLISVFNDSGAYLIGSWRGKNPLAPPLSPSKTLEGALGGIVCAVAIGILCRGLLPMTFHPVLIGFIALLVAIAGQVGDLLESYFKRIHGIKDFGSALGSHGGIFDRIDSHFAAAIVFLILVHCFR